MSKLTETKRAYDKLLALIKDEIRSRKGNVDELRRFQESLDVAFYLLGWAQFEYLVAGEAQTVVDENKRAKGKQGLAWGFLDQHFKQMSVRQKLELVVGHDPKKLAQLQKDYSVRNEAAHAYKNLPPEARDVSLWMKRLEDTIDLL